VDQEGDRRQLDQPVGETDETARIREQIEHTRANLSGTIGELQDRLRPENIVHQAGDAVRGAVEQKVKTMVSTATSTAESLSEQVQTHPLPTMLAVGGLAWWLTRRRRHAGYSDRSATPWLPALAAGAVGYYLVSQHMLGTDDQGARRSGYDYDDVSRAAEQGARAVSDRVRELGETADEYRQRAQAAAGEYAGQVSAQARQYGEQARQYGEAARQRMEETTTMLLERSEELTENFDRWMEENPLTVGIAAFALGAIAGLSLPVTRAEQRTLGAARDTLMEQAGQAVGAAIAPAS
jgi:uncharacterized protein (TIGR03382 family)